MKRRTVPLVAAAMLALLAAAPATSHTGCRITNKGTGVTYTSLSSAVGAANAGDTLLIRNTCGGNIDINKDLTLTGQRPVGSPLPAIVARTSPSSNITVSRSGAFPEITTVVFNKLRISGGNAGRDGQGGGIFVCRGCDVTLNDSKVTNNRAGNGAGIWDAGTLTLNDSAIRGNKATVFPGAGGGIFVLFDGVVVLKGSRIIDNAARSGGGVFQFANELGSVTLNNSTIRGNTAETGGGAYNSGSTLVLNRQSTITENVATSGNGGGVWMPLGTLMLNGASMVFNNIPNDICDGISCV